MSYPTLDTERGLLETYDAVIGVDEVGRGALAGPVAVGAFRLTALHLDSLPQSLRDSKLIPEKQRPDVAAEVVGWGESRVGMCSVEVIETKGISFALRSAALDAIEELRGTNTIVLLDGSHNWLGDIGMQVIIKTKADRDCGSVAAASVVAKVARDGLMQELSKDFPDYGWNSNKGYSSSSHIQAIQTLGPSQHHRASWLEKILSKDLGLF